MKPSSPLTNSTNVKLLKEVPTEHIIQGYKNGLGIDVSEYFKEQDSIQLYECLDTSIQFFYPIQKMGDSKFYEQLQSFDWYYMDWKWENQIILDSVKPNNKILEIGSGGGSFVKRLTELSYNITGLEMNQNSIEKAKLLNYKILGESIQEHADKNQEKYDLVCSFQVMEHIPELKEVITSSIKSLKSKGRLFISVPNNSSFIGEDTENILNMPPHHFSLWDKNVFMSLEKKFPIDLKKIYFEPIQVYHYEYFHNVKLKVLKSIFSKIFYENFYKVIIFPLIKNFPSVIPGFTIIGEFEKR
ncbi:MAG: class I SAM-dependent methyltransferase [Leptospiraceae bacterium]|nr:class I SAM-dependent methyltransferase [Leptospiraceae bacterium]